VTGRDPSPAPAGGRVTSDRGFSGASVPPPPPSARGKPRPVTPCQRAPGGSLRGAIRRGTDGFAEPGNPRVSPVRRSPPAVAGGLDSPGRTLVVTERTKPSGATGFSPRSALFVCPTLGWGVLFSRFPASRGGMAPSAAHDAPAAMAVDREAEGGGARLGPEEDIDDDVLANLLSAS